MAGIHFQCQKLFQLASIYNSRVLELTHLYAMQPKWMWFVTPMFVKSSMRKVFRSFQHLLLVQGGSRWEVTVSPERPKPSHCRDPDPPQQFMHFINIISCTKCTYCQHKSNKFKFKLCKQNQISILVKKKKSVPGIEYSPNTPNL